MKHRNIVQILKTREQHPIRLNEELNNTLERAFLFNPKSIHNDIPLSSSVSSTIAIAFSRDGQSFATTHGDHTVKIFFFDNGKQIRNFMGHPRTPWTVKYHPIDSNIVASGCLGYEVRIWNIDRNLCLNVVRFDCSIISIAFHPQGNYIAVASGTRLEIWDWKKGLSISHGGELNYEGSTFRTVSHVRNIRAVLFHPKGDYIFAAAPDTPRIPSESLTPCRLYAFPFKILWKSQGSASRITQASSITSPNSMEDDLLPLVRIADLIPQIHLYSDGGLDISTDGNYLLTCALLYFPPVAPGIDENMNYTFSPLSHRDRVVNDDLTSKFCDIIPQQQQPPSFQTAPLLNFVNNLLPSFQISEPYPNNRNELTDINHHSTIQPIHQPHQIPFCNQFTNPTPICYANNCPSLQRPDILSGQNYMGSIPPVGSMGLPFMNALPNPTYRNIPQYPPLNYVQTSKPMQSNAVMYQSNQIHFHPTVYQNVNANYQDFQSKQPNNNASGKWQTKVPTIRQLNPANSRQMINPQPIMNSNYYTHPAAVNAPAIQYVPLYYWGYPHQGAPAGGQNNNSSPSREIRTPYYGQQFPMKIQSPHKLHRRGSFQRLQQMPRPHKPINQKVHGTTPYLHQPFERNLPFEPSHSDYVLVNYPPNPEGLDMNNRLPGHLLHDESSTFPNNLHLPPSPVYSNAVGSHVLIPSGGFVPPGIHSFQLDMNYNLNSIHPSNLPQRSPYYPQAKAANFEDDDFNWINELNMDAVKDGTAADPSQLHPMTTEYQSPRHESSGRSNATNSLLFNSGTELLRQVGSSDWPHIEEDEEYFDTVDDTVDNPHMEYNPSSPSILMDKRFPLSFICSQPLPQSIWPTQDFISNSNSSDVLTTSTAATMYQQSTQSISNYINSILLNGGNQLRQGVYPMTKPLSTRPVVNDLNGSKLPQGWTSQDHLCIFRLNFSEDGRLLLPTLLRTKHLPGSLMKAVTSTKLSPTSMYALIGYGVRYDGEVKDHAEKHVACEVVSLVDPALSSVKIMSDDEDEVNVAQFHPLAGNGMVYGTKRGKVRSFSRCTEGEK